MARDARDLRRREARAKDEDERRELHAARREVLDRTLGMLRERLPFPGSGYFEGGEFGGTDTLPRTPWREGTGG